MQDDATKSHQGSSLREPTLQLPDLPAAWLCAQTAATAIVVSWYAGGEAKDAPALYAVMAGSSLVFPLWMQAVRVRVHWLALLPAGLMTVFLGVALLNPSHVPSPSGGWAANSNWIRWLPTTMDRAASLHQAIPWIATIVHAGVLAALRPPGKYCRVLWTVLVANAFILSISGATVSFAGSRRIMGLVATDRDYFFATFTYRNHWAAYALLLAAVAGGFMLSFWRRARNDPRRIGQAQFFTLATAMIAFTPVLPGSRSGTVMMAVLVVVLFGMLAWTVLRSNGSTRRRFLLTGVIGAVSLGVALSLAWPSVQRRLNEHGSISHSLSTLTSSLRFQISKDTVRMATDRPVYGWGLGTYANVFPLYQGTYLKDANGRAQTRVDKAHNDWAQFWAELGVVGFGIVLVPLGLALKSGWIEAGTVGRWAVVGCMAVAAYALVEFPFRNLALLSHWIIFATTANRLSSGR